MLKILNFCLHVTSDLGTQVWVWQIKLGMG